MTRSLVGVGGGAGGGGQRLEVQRRAAIALLVSVGLTVGLYALPYPYDRYAGYPLMLLSTLVHELGHGVAGLMVGALASTGAAPPPRRPNLRPALGLTYFSSVMPLVDFTTPIQA